MTNPQNGHVEFIRMEVVHGVGVDTEYRENSNRKWICRHQDTASHDCDIFWGQSEVAVLLLENIRGHGQNVVRIQNHSLAESSVSDAEEHMGRIFAYNGKSCVSSLGSVGGNRLLDPVLEPSGLDQYRRTVGQTALTTEGSQADQLSVTI